MNWFYRLENIEDLKKGKCGNLESKRGITLIALVITIIILLLLAGISINMITSQDGILNKATKAKEETSIANLKEKVELAVTEWNLEKESNDSYTTTLEEYLESKDEIASAKLSEPLTWISGDTVITISEGNKVTVGNKSKNLIRNGYLENKNNDNFPNLHYNQGGYLTYTTNELANFPRYFGSMSNDYVSIDSSRKYKVSITAKTDNINSKIWLGIAQFDIDYNNIAGENFMYVQNTLTYLTEDLKNGDTEIHLNDISNFQYNQNIKSYKKGLIFWNYKDSTGYQYEPLTYSRNIYIDLYDYSDDEPALDKENNIIKLKEPWSKGTIETGTQVSQSDDDETYNYVFYNTSMSENWKTKSKTIQGIINDGTNNNTRKFRPGAKYIKFVYYSEVFDASQNATAYMKDIVFEEVEE